MLSPRGRIRPSFFAGRKGRRTVYSIHLEVAFAQEVADRLGVNTGTVGIEAGNPSARSSVMVGLGPWAVLERLWKKLPSNTGPFAPDRVRDHDETAGRHGLMTAANT
jgi:hypothetical protein